MLPRHHPDGIQIAFDDHRLVANAGLMLPATLARRLGLPQLVEQHLDLGRALGRSQHRRQADHPGGFGPRWRRLPSLAATASTAPTCCVLAGRPGSWAVWSRPHPPWGPSCAASAGGT